MRPHKAVTIELWKRASEGLGQACMPVILFLAVQRYLLPTIDRSTHLCGNRGDEREQDEEEHEAPQGP